MRYVVEAAAKEPTMRRIKDTKRARYLKQPHGSELWPAEVAKAKAAELNDARQAVIARTEIGRPSKPAP